MAGWCQLTSAGCVDWMAEVEVGGEVFEDAPHAEHVEARVAQLARYGQLGLDCDVTDQAPSDGLHTVQVERALAVVRLESIVCG